MRSRRRLHAFTLVELLVVIAIIAVLISLLIGPIMRARRAALVLACPIATQAAGSSSVLVHPHGGAELAVAPPPKMGDTCGPEWSTNGTWIGYTAYIGTNGESRTAIVHAMTGKVRTFGYAYGPGNDGSFAGWADDDHFISVAISSSSSVPAFFIREATTGRVSETYESALARNYGERDMIFRRVPAATGAYYIATIPSVSFKEIGEVLLLRKDFSVRKLVYRSSQEAGVGPIASVDPLGEYAAWSALVWTADNSTERIAPEIAQNSQY